jgi:hypothetical protein
MIGIFAWKNQTQGTFDPRAKRFRKFNGLKGVSDILGILPDGTFLAIEVKRAKPKTYPTKDQKEFIKNITISGGVAFVARSIDDITKNLKPVGKNMFEDI